jgi:gluconate 2-dehydrogenase gamma chain
LFDRAFVAIRTLDRQIQADHLGPAEVSNHQADGHHRPSRVLLERHGGVMSKHQANDSKADRRGFLKMVGAAGAATALPFSDTAQAAEKTRASAHAAHNHVAKAASRQGAVGYQFFNVNESAFIETAVDTLIPKDSVGPGAAELGVAIYIDRQMAGAFGKGDRLYLDGPFGEGTPEQGNQLAMTPAELIRAGIADVNEYTRKTYAKSFDLLPNEDRIATMVELDKKKLNLPTVPAEAFFTLLLQLTVEGYFADPMYGGNKDKSSWKMIGFPGADAMYMDKIEPFRNKPYTAAPKGIADLI